MTRLRALAAVAICACACEAIAPFDESRIPTPGGAGGAGGVGISGNGPGAEGMGGAVAPTGAGGGAGSGATGGAGTSSGGSCASCPSYARCVSNQCDTSHFADDALLRLVLKSVSVTPDECPSLSGYVIVQLIANNLKGSNTGFCSDVQACVLGASDVIEGVRPADFAGGMSASVRLANGDPCWTATEPFSLPLEVKGGDWSLSYSTNPSGNSLVFSIEPM